MNKIKPDDISKHPLFELGTSISSPYDEGFLVSFLDGLSKFPSRPSKSLETAKFVEKSTKNNDTSVYNINVAGINPDEIKVELSGNTVLISTPKGVTTVDVKNFDTDNIKVVLKWGMLTISCPKRNNDRVLKVETA